MWRWMRTSVLLALAIPVAIQAQEAQEAQGGDVAVELARINANLEKIASLLSRMDEAEGLDLLMKRVQLASARIGEDERRLRSVESELRSLESEKEALVFQHEIAETRAVDDPGSEAEATVRMIERQQKWIRERISELSLEVNELRNRLVERERDLEGWQQIVDRRLGAH